MKQYGFRLFDRDTRSVAEDFGWFLSAGARETAIQKSTSHPRYAIERTGRHSLDDAPMPAEEDLLSAEHFSK
jgi:hypothetical protein